MRTIPVEIINGKRENEIVYNIDDFPYTKYIKSQKVKRKNQEYYNIPAAFDIETTTIKPKDENQKPFGFMYQWQFCLVDCVVFGRTWEEFTTFLERLRKYMKLDKDNRLVVFVHNLAYEFQFISQIIEYDELFCKDKRKPMKLHSNGLEFRCSYFLSNMSLAKFCENCKGVTHYKQIDVYNYRKLRTPVTPLTETEESYCYNDVKGLCECINYLLREDTILSMPLTNTGYVRREYRQAMKSNKDNWYNFNKCRLSPDNYKMLKKCFRGGNTHANRHMSNLILSKVYSFDIQSSYPTSIMLDDFPITPFMEINLNNQEKLEYYMNNYCLVLEVEFFNIELNYNEVIPYIDVAHCTQKCNIVNDNGRVLSADYIKVTLTNIDLEIILKTYHSDGYNVLKSICAKKGKLPKELRLKLLDFYKAKTMLKGVDGKEYEYMKSKNRVNATFGMMVTAIDHTEIEFNINNFEWFAYAPDIEKSLDDFYKSRNNFLSYQWGVFVTANARKRLQEMLYIVGEDVVYIDTDSIKFVDERHIAEFDEINKKLIEQAENNDIQAYVTKDGKKYYLGTWDNDGAYIRFKTLGAKKYCYESYNDDGSKGFHITVSGMSKKDGAKAVGSIENFNIGKTFHNVGRTVSYYNDEKPHKITIDGCTFTTASNIGIVDTTYTLGVTDEYWSIIGMNEISD